MKNLRRLALPLGLAGLLAAASGPLRQDPDEVELRLEPVAGSVHCLYGRGGNIGVSQGPDGLLVVDSQFEWLAPGIVRRIGELSDESPTFLVNTHFHFDHVGGNAVVRGDGTIVAHANVRERLAAGRGAGGQEAEPAAKEMLPVVTYEDGLSIHFNGEEIRLVHLPACHTDGDTAVWFTGSGVLHLGDAFFAGKFPFIDVASGGDVRGMIDGLEGLLERVPEDTRIVPGHGEVCGTEEVRAYLDMLREASSRVSDALAAGRTAEEMNELGLLDDLAGEWGGGFIPAPAFIEALATCLADE